GSTYRNDRIVATGIQVESVTRDHFYLAEPGALEVAPGRLGQFREDFDGAHARAHRREAGGHESGAAADHQRAHPGRGVERLEEASDNFWRQHVLTRRERDVSVRERQPGVAFGYEKLARRATHGIEHALVEHVPRAYLLA